MVVINMNRESIFYAIAVGVVTGIAIAYMQKSERLERLNGIQDETIKGLREYIEWAESDHSKIYARRIDE
jgi:hypothetical protein